MGSGCLLNESETDAADIFQRFVVRAGERAACKKQRLPLVWCPVAMMTTPSLHAHY
jgi:hypothetical protein